MTIIGTNLAAIAYNLAMFIKWIIAGVLLLASGVGFLWWIASSPATFAISLALTAVIVVLLNLKRQPTQ